VKSIKNTGIVQGLGMISVALGIGYGVHWVPGLFAGALGLGMVSGNFDPYIFKIKIHTYKFCSYLT
jgi:hypothetical protein